MPLTQKPVKPELETYRPTNATIYLVTALDSWGSLAHPLGIDIWDLIDFNFADFQLDEAINSQTPYYIKSVCTAKVRLTDTFALLIGGDTYTDIVRGG